MATRNYPKGPLADHEAASDPHAAYQKESEKNAASGYVGIGSSTKAAGASIAASDQNLIFVSGNGNITLPAASAWPAGRPMWVKKTDSGVTTTLQRAGSDTIDGATSFALTTQYQALILFSNGSNAWSVI